MTLLIDGDPLKDSKGREIGTMTADSFLENSGREIYQYQYATLTLYFANEAGDHLVKETRRVPYSTNIPLERVVVEQLMKRTERRRPLCSAAGYDECLKCHDIRSDCLCEF